MTVDTQRERCHHGWVYPLSEVGCSACLYEEVLRLKKALATCFYYADGAKQFDGSAWRYEHWRLKKIAEVARECMEESVA